jgi:tetratricopeptide (TPR) repeat protein
LLAVVIRLSAQLNIDSLDRILAKESDTAQISRLVTIGLKLSRGKSGAGQVIYQRLTILCDKTKEIDYKIRAGTAVAERYRIMGIPDSAIFFHKKIEPYISKCKNNIILSTYYYSVGFTLNLAGNFDGASKAALESLKYAELSKSDERKCYAYIVLADNSYDLKDYDKSLEYSQNSITFAQKINRFDLLAYQFMTAGNVYGASKRYDEAIVEYNHAYKIFDSLNMQSRVAQLLNSIGGMYYYKKDYKKAESYLRQSYSLKEKLGDPTLVSSTLNMVEFLIETKQLDSAGIYLVKAGEMIEARQNLYYKDHFYEKSMEYWAARNDFKKALEFSQLLKHIDDSLYNESITSTSKELEEKYQNEANSRQLEKSEKEKEIAELQSARSMIFIWCLVAVLLLVVGFGFSFYRNYRQKKILSDQLSIQNAEISMQKKEITDSINYATHIQRSILIKDSVWKNDLPDSFIFYLPKDIVSGDFYWMQPVIDGVLFAVGDCTGHGVPGAMVSIVCAGALKASVKEHRLTQPSLILDKSNELLAEAFQS